MGRVVVEEGPSLQRTLQVEAVLHLKSTNQIQVEISEFWANTDMINAFDQVLHAPGLRRLFGTDIFSPTTQV